MRNLIGLSLILTISLPLCSFADVVAQWHFDENPGATTAVASVGGVNGSLSGSADFVPGGIVGNAVSLSRTGNGLVNMGDNFGFTSGDFSVVAWVKTAADYAVPDSFILGKHRATIVAGYLLGLNANGSYGAQDKVWFYDSNGSPGDEPTSTTSVNDGQWHQVVAVYHAGGNSEIHVDGPGAEDTKQADTMAAISAPFLIGGLEFGGQPTSQLDAQVDEVQLYDHALNSCQLQYLFDNPDRVIPSDCDQDGVDDDADNCSAVPNPSQADGDMDGIGNRCDADFDNNCITTFPDLAIMKTGFFTVDTLLDLDSSGGPVNFADLAIMKDLFFLAPGPSGIPNSCNGDLR